MWRSSKYFLLSTGIFCLPLELAAQAQQVWITYNLQARLHRNWSLLADANHRVESFKLLDAVVTAARVGGMYHLTERKTLSAGYAWFATHASGNNKALLHENRLWQQYQIGHVTHSGMLMQRMRTEQRFREAMVANRREQQFSVRARYMASILFPVKRLKHGSPGISLQLADELMLHAGEGIRMLYDQNRLIAGVHLGFTPTLSTAFLYQLTHQYQAAADAINPIHVVRITLMHVPDWRSKKIGDDRND